jgi:segregation and condensation protein B
MTDTDLDSLLSEPAFVDGEAGAVAKRHLRGLLESLLFVSDRPQKTADLAEIARAETREVRQVLEEISDTYRSDARGFLLEESAGGWQFRTNPTFAPFVRELTQAKPVKLTRAQIETLAIIAYRQPLTRPEIEDIRGVDVGGALRVLLDRDLVRVLGKKEEPGRPLLYGTTAGFLAFFGLKSLKELPTLREFTELSEDSRDVYEREIGEVLPEGPKEPVPADAYAPSPEHAESTENPQRGETLTPPTLRDDDVIEPRADDSIEAPASDAPATPTEPTEDSSA